jgi:ribosomal protein S27E
MNDEIRVPVSLPLDSDGFLRRECPTCEREFKWFSHVEGDLNAEIAEQYFCPLCGVAAATDSWWTTAQLDYLRGVSGPALDQYVQDSVSRMLGGIRGLKVTPNRSFSLGIETPTALEEFDDMTIVEPPCHPNEPVKVPDEDAANVHCLICGTEFAA